MTRHSPDSTTKVQPMTRSDLPEAATVLYSAFKASPLEHFIEPEAHKQQQRFLDGLVEVWDQPAHDKFRYLKAVDESSGRIVGAAVWAALDGTEFLDPDAMTALTLPMAPLAFPTCSSAPAPPKSGLSALIRKSPAQKLLEEFMEQSQEGRRRWIVGKPVQFLIIVGVLPDYQGHGIGESLVQVGMDEADQRQVACFLGATPSGYPVYKRLGWNRVDEQIDFDISEYAGKGSGYGDYSFNWMLRLPNVRRPH